MSLCLLNMLRGTEAAISISSRTSRPDETRQKVNPSIERSNDMATSVSRKLAAQPVCQERTGRSVSVQIFVEHHNSFQLVQQIGDEVFKVEHFLIFQP